MNNINALTLILPTGLMMTSCRNVYHVRYIIVIRVLIKFGFRLKLIINRANYV